MIEDRPVLVAFMPCVTFEDKDVHRRRPELLDRVVRCAGPDRSCEGSGGFLKLKTRDVMLRIPFGLVQMTDFFEEIGRAVNRSNNSSAVLSRIADIAAVDARVEQLFRAAEVPAFSPHLAMAAIHSLLLAHRDEALADYFGTLGGRLNVTDGDFQGSLVDFVGRYGAALASRVRHRKFIVKTDIRRAAILRALVASAWKELGSPARYALVDLGCGIGVNLLLDRIEMRSNSHEILMCFPNSVDVSVQIKTDRAPTIKLPRAVRRVGIDVHRFDIHSDEDRNWLLGNIMPEDDRAMAALGSAMTALKDDPPEVLVGDASVELDAVLNQIEPDVAVIVMHSMMMHFLSAQGKEAISGALVAAAQIRPVARVSFEIAGAAATLESRMGSTQSPRLYGRAHLDGAWVKWVGEAPKEH